MNDFKYEPIEIFTSLDLEMNQPSGKIIQIGAVVGNISTGEILERLSVMINPNEELNPEIIKLTGITQEDVDGGVTLEEGYRQLETMHKKHKSFVNPITWGGGDSAELRNELVALNPDFQGWCFGRRWIDTKTIFVSLRFANGEPIQGGLGRSLVKVGLKFKGRKHNALDDAENTFYMYLKLLKALRRDPEQTAEQPQQPQS